MGETTGIEWTGATWNPWRGCRKVSAGCAHCYMYREQKRYGRDPSVVVRAQPATFNAPLRWKEPGYVFSCSWSDFFIEEADPWRDEAWAIIRATPHLTYQILTKRPERISEHLPTDWGREGYPNVWLGVSGETWRLAFERGMYLSQVRARVHFLSAEPFLDDLPDGSFAYTLQFYDWVILGGESGPGARPLSPGSARAVRDACVEQEVPFFFKQWGGVRDKRDHDAAVIDGQRWVEMPKARESE